MKSRLKKLLGNVVNNDFIFNLFDKGDLTIFLYHDVTDNPSNFSKKYNLNVPPEVFDIQLDFIKEHYQVISPEQLKSGDYSGPAALITFDDGLPSYFEEAVPILSSKDMPSIVFLNMGPVNGDIFWSGLVTYLCEYSVEFRAFLLKKNQHSSDKNLFLLCTPNIVNEFLSINNSEEILSQAKLYYGRFSTIDHCNEMRSKVGQVYFGSHLYNHYNAKMLSEPELLENLQRNHVCLSSFPNYIDFFSYPFGHPKTCFNSITNNIVSKFGYTKIFSAYNIINSSSNNKILNRLSLGDSVITRHSFRYNLIVPRFLNMIYNKLL